MFFSGKNSLFLLEFSCKKTETMIFEKIKRIEEYIEGNKKSNQ